ncbi:MAG: hypothetical protein C4523_08175 [Myxococcales bacterium]|nr:MAG: hypothetical protein C4523_08175 [Myxococcales bacterium]
MSGQPSVASAAAARLFALTVGLAVYLGFYLLDGPRLFFLPETRDWTFSPPEGAIPMGYYGLLLNAAAAYALALVAARLPLVGERLAAPRVVAALAWIVRVLLVAGLAAVLVRELVHWGARAV